MDPNDNTTKDYLELKPRRANILGIFRVLSSDDYKEECKGFIKSEETKEEVAEQRGIIFVSILAQKLLQCVRKPLSLLGSVLEMCLNILCNKTNFYIFFNNLFRGKVVLPDERSASFVSMNGHLDNRVDLDNNINPGTHRYFAALSAMASKLAYENDEFIKLTIEKTWKMELLGSFSFWDDRYNGDITQAFLFRDNTTNPDTIVLAFRGTEPFNADDWSTDFDISWCSLQAIEGRVHCGFVKALGLIDPPETGQAGKTRPAYAKLTQLLDSHINNVTKTRLIITGHSLGGALAVLFPTALVMHNKIGLWERLEAVYTFGQPRIGDARFGKFMEEKFRVYGVEYYRFVYNHDIVPRLPFDSSSLMFKHFGTCIYINSLYEAKIVEEEPLKNYFGYGWWLVAKRVDVMWEVARSFLLPRMFGPEYKESWVLLMFRMMGLVLPGLPEHGLQDYINATRLAIY